MASSIVFNCFALDLASKVHDLGHDVLKVYLSNDAPLVSSDATYTDGPTDLSTGGGYTAGGISIGTNTLSQVSGVCSLVPGGSLTWTAAGGGFGPFRYAILYNATASAKNLICYWDNGTSASLASGDFDFNLGAQIFTYHF